MPFRGRSFRPSRRSCRVGRREALPQPVRRRTVQGPSPEVARQAFRFSSSCSKGLFRVSPSMPGQVRMAVPRACRATGSELSKGCFWGSSVRWCVSRAGFWRPDAVASRSGDPVVAASSPVGLAIPDPRLVAIFRRMGTIYGQGGASTLLSATVQCGRRFSAPKRQAGCQDSIVVNRTWCRSAAVRTSTAAAGGDSVTSASTSRA